MAEVEKKGTEYTEVAMADGRSVKFAGKRKVNKEVIIDESKVTLDGTTLMIAAGAVSVRMDFRNGDTRLLPLPLSLFAHFAGMQDTAAARSSVMNWRARQTSP